MKKCTRCYEYRPLECFGENSSGTRKPICEFCQSKKERMETIRFCFMCGELKEIESFEIKNEVYSLKCKTCRKEEENIMDSVKEKPGFTIVELQLKRQDCISIQEWAASNGFSIGNYLFHLHRCFMMMSKTKRADMRIAIPYQNKKDNIKDETYVRGEDVYTAKLTGEKVEMIRHLRGRNKVTVAVLAKLFDVSISTISSVCHRQTWRHI